MDVFDQNTVVPVVVIIACVAACALTYLITRDRPTSVSVPSGDRRRRGGQRPRDPGPMQPRVTDTMRTVPPAYRTSTPAGLSTNGAAAVGSLPGADPEPAPAMALETWHRHYGASVHAWIKNHEALLDEITDGGLEIQAVSRELTERHEQLAPIIRDAIEAHPAPEMRAQLSAMIVSSQATLHSLHRRQYDSAERQHLTYLDYRDSWLQRLRQFETSDANSREMWDLADQQRSTPGWS